MDEYRQYVYTQLEGLSEAPDVVVEGCAWYINELLKWNKSINLTSVTTPRECWEKHIQDSLLALPYVYAAQNMLDIGSGAGIPAIPLKLSCPNLHVVAVDKARKKINFQNHCKRQLKLLKFEAICANITTLNRFEHTFDVVIARALAPLETIIKLGAIYIKPGGMLLALKSHVDKEELTAGISAAQPYGLVLEQTLKTALQPSLAKRKILIWRRNNQPHN